MPEVFGQIFSATDISHLFYDLCFMTVPAYLGLFDEEVTCALMEDHLIEHVQYLEYHLVVFLR